MTRSVEHVNERYVAAILRRTAGPAADPQDAPDVVAAYLAACLEKGWLEREAGEIRCFRAWLKVQLARFTRTWVRDRSAARRWAPTLPSDDALADAATRAEGVAWDAAAIRSHAEQFSEARFLEGLRAEIGRLMDGRAR